MNKKPGMKLHLRRFYAKGLRSRADIAAIAIEAQGIAETPYNSENGYPANVYGISQQILVQARLCMALIDENADTELALAAGFELGRLCESANKVLAAWAALEEKRASRQEKVAAAEARHSKPGGSRDLKAKIQAIWATGKYSSRDICAEEEWSALGFGSFSTARRALRNTSDNT